MKTLKVLDYGKNVTIGQQFLRIFKPRGWFFGAFYHQTVVTFITRNLEMVANLPTKREPYYLLTSLFYRRQCMQIQSNIKKCTLKNVFIHATVLILFSDIILHGNNLNDPSDEDNI